MNIFEKLLQPGPHAIRALEMAANLRAAESEESYLPATLIERADQCIITRRAQIIVANLGNITGEQPDLDYETACWYVTQAQLTHAGDCETEMRKRIRSRVDTKTLEYCATGRV